MTEQAEIIDPQIEAVMAASGHTFEDVCRFLTKLNQLGWTVRPMAPAMVKEDGSTTE